MTINDAVMNDLLTLYLAGEASPETRALVEAHARTNAAFAARLQAAGTRARPMGQARLQRVRASLENWGHEPARRHRGRPADYAAAPRS